MEKRFDRVQVTNVCASEKDNFMARELHGVRSSSPLHFPAPPAILIHSSNCCRNLQIREFNS